MIGLTCTGTRPNEATGHDRPIPEPIRESIDDPTEVSISLSLLLPNRRVEQCELSALVRRHESGKPDTEKSGRHTAVCTQFAEKRSSYLDDRLVRLHRLGEGTTVLAGFEVMISQLHGDCTGSDPHLPQGGADGRSELEKSMIEVFHAIEVFEEGALRRDRLPVLVWVYATTIDAVKSTVEPLTPPRSEPSLEPLRLNGSGVSNGYQTFPPELIDECGPHTR